MTYLELIEVHTEHDFNNFDQHSLGGLKSPVISITIIGYVLINRFLRLRIVRTQTRLHCRRGHRPGSGDREQAGRERGERCGEVAGGETAEPAERTECGDQANTANPVAEPDSCAVLISPEARPCSSSGTAVAKENVGHRTTRCPSNTN